MADQNWIPEVRKDLIPDKIRVVNAVLNKIPKLSLSVQKIIEMIGNKDVDSRELVEVASADPVLASRILMMVNSSYYGLKRKIDNLRLAIVLLGFNEVRDIAIQTGVMKTITDAKYKQVYDTRKLWTHSYLVSICAETFAGEDDPKKAGVFMTMGILHDIGKFALQAIGEMMEKKGITSPAAKEFSPEISFLANEQNIFGVNHSIIGALLGEKWNLSDRVCNVIEYHHYPSFFSKDDIPAEFIDDVAIISISDFIVNKVYNENVLLEEPPSYYFELLGLTPPLESVITEELKSKLFAAEEYANALA